MPETQPQPREWYSPTLRRILFAVILAAGGFFIPQGVPLVWYPLNEPGDDILYLEIKCAADGEGLVKIYQNLTQGINELDTIEWPIAASENTYTYTFPLPDAPIVELRLDPPSLGVSLRVDNFQIIDRRGKVMRHFSREAITPQNQIASLEATPTGWIIKSTPESPDPFARIEIGAPIVAHDMTPRNALRSLLSTGYLAGMLWIILLAVLFTFWRPVSVKDAVVHLGYMALLAAVFAFVGNRGLIRNSWHYSRFIPPPPSEVTHLEIDFISPTGTQTQLFWDTGNDFNETESQRTTLAASPNLQSVWFPLPATSINGLRLDPSDRPGQMKIRGIRVVDGNRLVRAVIPPTTLEATREIERLSLEGNQLQIETTPDATDPILLFTRDAIAQINSAGSGAAPDPPR